MLHGDQLEPERPPAQADVAADLAGARELYRQGNYDKAESLFEIIADDTKNAVPVAEEDCHVARMMVDRREINFAVAVEVRSDEREGPALDREIFVRRESAAAVAVEHRNDVEHVVGRRQINFVIAIEVCGDD